MLAKEDMIEEDFEKQVITACTHCTHMNRATTLAFSSLQAKAPVKPKTFTVALNTQFFDCARYASRSVTC